MASFNSFPIPTVLEQLKNADVDDAIHDIAERKHVFEGPMRLNDGRIYIVRLKGHAIDDVSGILNVPVRFATNVIHQLQASTSAKFIDAFFIITLNGSASCRCVSGASGDQYGLKNTNLQTLRVVPSSEGVISVDSVENFELDEFLIIEV